MLTAQWAPATAAQRTQQDGPASSANGDATTPPHSTSENAEPASLVVADTAGDFSCGHILEDGPRRTRVFPTRKAVVQHG
eukprot:15484985-Alexandrium_andersonii.AAC.1